MTWYNVSELEGALLDKAVFKALLPIAMRLYPRENWSPDYVPPQELAYSSDWAAGGPIIERERITLIAPDERPDQLSDPRVLWCAATYHVNDDEDEEEFEQFADTPLVAAMRAFVASKFGDEVDL